MLLCDAALLRCCFLLRCCRGAGTMNAQEELH